MLLAKRLMMTPISMNMVVQAPASTVWNTISDFEGITKYLPIVRKCTLDGVGDGAVRTLELIDGSVVVERLDKIDHQQKSLHYSLIESPLPIAEYTSVIQVQSLTEERCEMVWTSQLKVPFDMEMDAIRLMESLCTMCFHGIKKLHGG